MIILQSASRPCTRYRCATRDQHYRGHAGSGACDMSPNAHQISYELLRDELRRTGATAVSSGCDGGGIGYPPGRASAALYVLLGDHPVADAGAAAPAVACTHCRAARIGSAGCSPQHGSTSTNPRTCCYGPSRASRISTPRRHRPRRRHPTGTDRRARYWAIQTPPTFSRRSTDIRRPGLPVAGSGSCRSALQPAAWRSLRLHDLRERSPGTATLDSRDMSRI